MNENHHRRIGVSFQYIDGLLRDAVQALSTTDDDSPFSRLVQDATPVQGRVIADYARRVRGLMVAAQERLGIPADRPRIAATRTALTNFTMAEVTLDDIEPERLRGSGEVSSDAARALADSCAEIHTVLRQMSAYLSAGSGANLDARLAQLGAGTDLAILLKELARVIAAHGLVALRPAIERLVEQAASDSYEIAVFGRVSSGKSSLLNHVLGRAVLPVGVTPVTALPTRIGYGPAERAVIRFAGDRPIDVPIAWLDEYATEQHNPANRKHVTEIRVELTEERLRDGVTLVDTPGLGSLATSGAAESLAYLPRADLGIVLTDASAALMAEDVAVVDKLVRSGARAMVVLSKVDLLAAGERERVHDYVARQLAAELGFEVAVHFVSVVGADAALADRWFESQIRPQFAAQRRLRAQSLARKAATLREAVVATLRERVASAPLSLAAGRGPDWNEAAQALRRAAGMAEGALRSCLDLADLLMDASGAIVHRAAREIAAGGGLADARARLAMAVESHAGEVTGRIVAVLDELRAEMTRALQTAALLSSDTPEGRELPALRGLPALDASPIVRDLTLREPALGFLSKGFRRARLAEQIIEQVGAMLDDALLFHRHRLQDWLRHALPDLREAFSGAAGQLQSRIEQTAGSPSDLTAEERAAVESDIRGLMGVVSSDHSPRPDET